MANDLTNLLSVAKTRFTVRSQSSDQLLGYALMLPDVKAVDDYVKFVPWEEEVQLSLVVASGPIPTSPCADQELELYLSESSSWNETLESEPPAPGGRDEFNLDVNLSQSPVTTQPPVTTQSPVTTLGQNFPQSQSSFQASSQNSVSDNNFNQTSRHSPTSSPEDQDSSQAASCNSSLITSQSSSQTSVSSLVIVSKLTTASKHPAAPPLNSLPLELQYVPGTTKSCSQSLACQIVAEHERSNIVVDKGAKSDIKSNRKRKSEELDTNSNKRIVNPENSTAKYDVFIELIERAEDKKDSKVKCILCSDGKIYLYGSMQRHIKGIHMSPVKCDVCNNEFSAAGVDNHRRKCVRKKFKMEEKYEKIKRIDASTSNLSTKLKCDHLDALNCNHLLTDEYMETTKSSGIFTKKKLVMLRHSSDSESSSGSSSMKTKNIRMHPPASRNILSPPCLKLSGGSEKSGENEIILIVNGPESKYDCSSKDEFSSKKEDSSNKKDSSCKKDDSSCKKYESLSNDDSSGKKESSSGKNSNSFRKKDDCSSNKDSLIKKEDTDDTFDQSSVVFPLSLPKDFVSLTLKTSTVNGVSNSIKMGINKEAKVKKAMKKFGTKFKVSHKNFNFFLGSQQLSGDESVVVMDGQEIFVVDKLPIV